jgi:hypothetical protein
MVQVQVPEWSRHIRDECLFSSRHECSTAVQLKSYRCKFFYHNRPIAFLIKQLVCTPSMLFPRIQSFHLINADGRSRKLFKIHFSVLKSAHLVPWQAQVSCRGLYRTIYKIAQDSVEVAYRVNKVNNPRVLHCVCGIFHQGLYGPFTFQHPSDIGL